MGLILDMTPKELEKVLYFASYVVLEPPTEENYRKLQKYKEVSEDKTPNKLYKKQLLTEIEYNQALEDYGDTFEVGMGAEAIKRLLQEIDLEEQKSF